MSKNGPTAEQRLLLAEVDLGLEADQFLRSKIGKYIVGRATDQSEAAMEKLKIVDPTDAKAVQSIQNDIWRADTLATWITDLIRGGKNAEDQINQGNDNSLGD